MTGLSHVVILGGGLTGLSAAYGLTRISPTTRVTVVEKQPHVGGWLRSIRHNDGSVFELGPRAVYLNSPSSFQLMNMVEEIGLEPRLLTVSSQSAATQARYIFSQGKLVRLPSRIIDLFRTQPPFKEPLIRAVINDLLFSYNKVVDDCTLYALTTERFSKEVADLIIDPMCMGIMGSDAKQTSARTAFQRVWEPYVSGKSILKSMMFPKKQVEYFGLAKKAKDSSWKMISFKTGIQELVEGLQTYLEAHHVDFLLGKPARVTTTGVGATCQIDGQTLAADCIISTLPAHALRDALPESSSELKSTLSSFKYTTIGLVNLEYNTSVCPLSAFGVLVPSEENLPVMGITFDSVSFPDMDSHSRTSQRFTVMMGGPRFFKFFGDPQKVTEDTLVRAALSAMKHVLGVQEQPVRFHGKVLAECLPHYQLQHFKLADMVKTMSFPAAPDSRLTIVGSLVQGVSVPDCVQNGCLAAIEVVKAFT